MIIDTLPNKYEVLALKNTFKPWQTGLLARMVSKSGDGEAIISINMGRSAGHTYFAKIAAASDFPARTKLYVTRQEQIREYSKLLFTPEAVHEPIDWLDKEDFADIDVPAVDYIVIDMNAEHYRRFREAILHIKQTIGKHTKILLMQGQVF